MLTGLETDTGRTAFAEVVRERAADLFLEAEHHGHREVESERAVGERVLEDRERGARARGRMQIE